MRQHHPDLSAEMFFVEAEGLGASTSEVHVRIHFHEVLSWCVRTSHRVSMDEFITHIRAAIGMPKPRARTTPDENSGRLGDAAHADRVQVVTI
jgi:hypothetical protein